MQGYEATKFWYWTERSARGQVEIEPTGDFASDLKLARKALRRKWGRQRLSKDTLLQPTPFPSAEEDGDMGHEPDRFVLEHTSRNGLKVTFAGVDWEIFVDVDELSDGDIELWERIVLVLNKYDDQIFVD